MASCSLYRTEIMARVMAVDTGTTAGVTCETADGRPEFHTLALKVGYDPEDRGFRYQQYEERLGDLIKLYRPDTLAFESPVMPRASRGGQNIVTTEATVRLLIGFAEITDLIGKRHGVDVVEVNIMTWKAHFASNGRATKHDVMARCRQLKWDVRNEHEADSAGVWAFVKSVTDPKFSYQTTPLFAGAAQ